MIQETLNGYLGMILTEKQKKTTIILSLKINLTLDQFVQILPEVTITLYFKSNDDEHYDVNEILCDSNDEQWLGGIYYRYYVRNPEELFERVKSILASESYSDRTKMSLLPMELFTYSETIPGKRSKISYETLSMFRSVELPAERDNFASNADKLGSKALLDLLQKSLSPDSQTNIEKKYN